MWFSNIQRFRYLLGSLKYLSCRRLLNGILLLFSFFYSRLTKKPRIMGSPWAMSVEPSGQCNLQCPECPVGAGVLTRKAGMLTLPLFEKMLDDAGPQLLALNLYFQGEPMLNRGIGDIIALAQQRKIYTSMSTNGHYLSPENCALLIKGGLSKLIVSVDGISRRSYSRYRKGGDLNKVKEGISNFLEQRRALGRHSPIISIQFLVFEHNEHEIEELTQWCRNMGVDLLELKSAQFYDFGNNEVSPPTIARYSRYTKEDGQWVMKGKSYNHCFKQWGSAVMSWDGRIAPCCYDKDLDFSPGSIRVSPLKEIWKNQSLMQFRRQVLKDKAAIAMCRNCPEGRKLII